MMIKRGVTGAILAMVNPQLHRPEHGDQSECCEIDMSDSPCLTPNQSMNSWHEPLTHGFKP